jgi:hypothetical protein
MDREMVRQILTINLNMKEVCAKVVPKNLPILAGKQPILEHALYSPGLVLCDFSDFPELK